MLALTWPSLKSVLYSGLARTFVDLCSPFAVILPKIVLGHLLRGCLLFSVTADEPVERGVQGPFPGEVPQLGLLAGVPQHLWPEIPFPTLSRGKEGGGLCSILVTHIYNVVVFTLEISVLVSRF